jgi:hypothetical protein
MFPISYRDLELMLLGRRVDANAARRHHIAKQESKVTNWAPYDASLRRFGSLTFWFSPTFATCGRRLAELSLVQPFLDVGNSGADDTLEDSFRCRYHGFRPANGNEIVALAP